jgi:signal transduction histidine kinase/integral membrane sensor domain MASE1
MVYASRLRRLPAPRPADEEALIDVIQEAESLRPLSGLSDRISGAGRLIGIGVAVAIAYVIAARLGFRFAFVAEQVTTVWAPTGIGLAALLLWGPSLWPAIWIGAFAANAGTNAPLWTAAAVATGNTLEAVVGAWLLTHVVGFDPKLRRLRDVVAFILAGAAVSTVVSATIGVSTLCVAAVQPWDRFDQLWHDWWLGDAAGALIVAPAILTAARHARPSRRGWIEGAALMIGAVSATHVVFGFTVALHPLEYVIFPFVVAAALRAGPPATSIVILGSSAVTIWHTVRGAGPFASPEVHASLIQLQAFMGILAGTGLLLAAAIAERETGERRRAAAAAVSEILSTAADLETAALQILRGICQSVEWQIGALWLVDHRDQRLRCLVLWSEDDRASEPFAAATRQSAFTSGTGLPGRVWASGQAAWIENVLHDANFPRARAAEQAGVRSAFAFPICLGQEVRGVIECFRLTVEPPDPDLLRTLSTVGTQVGQFIARTRDLSARMEAERDREELLLREATARSEAEAANRAKDEFLATLSHELRTPLNAIVGWSRMLRDGTLDPTTTRRALEVIDRNAQLQARLVADILDVSGIITGKLSLELTEVDLSASVAAALDGVRPAADAKSVQLTSRITATTTSIEGDAKRIQQVVWNLLVNAVKFSGAGGAVSIEVRDGAPGSIQIVVQDAGAGIDGEFLPHVFERFRQADTSTHREHGGLGLGLAIVRHLIELHGGTVRADSAGIGRGSTFTIEVPVRCPQPGATASSR